MSERIPIARRVRRCAGVARPDDGPLGRRRREELARDVVVDAHLAGAKRTRRAVGRVGLGPALVQGGEQRRLVRITVRRGHDPFVAVVPAVGDVRPVREGGHDQSGEGVQRVLDRQGSRQTFAAFEKQRQPRVRDLDLPAGGLFLDQELVVCGAQADLLAKIEDERHARERPVGRALEAGGADEHRHALAALRQVLLLVRRAPAGGRQLGQGARVEEPVLGRRHLPPRDRSRQELLARVVDQLQERRVGVGDPPLHIQNTMR
jgi:hypothetical protein